MSRAVPTREERATFLSTLTSVRAALLVHDRELGSFSRLPALSDESRSACVDARNAVTHVLASVNREMRGGPRG